MPMKNFWSKLSVTKLVFFILALVLSFVTIWNTVYGLDNKIFETIISMVFSFYFAQKWISYDNVDSILKEDKKDHLIDNDKE